MSLPDKLEDILNVAGEAGLINLAEALEALKPKNRLEEVALEAISDALEKHGLDALQSVTSEIVDLLRGDTLPDMDKLSPLARSDILAALQTTEADSPVAIKYVEAAGNILARILVATARSLIV